MLSKVQQMPDGLKSSAEARGTKRDAIVAGTSRLIRGPYFQLLETTTQEGTPLPRPTNPARSVSDDLESSDSFAI